MNNHETITTTTTAADLQKTLDVIEAGTCASVVDLALVLGVSFDEVEDRIDELRYSGQLTYEDLHHIFTNAAICRFQEMFPAMMRVAVEQEAAPF